MDGLEPFSHAPSLVRFTHSLFASLAGAYGKSVNGKEG